MDFSIKPVFQCIYFFQILAQTSYTQAGSEEGEIPAVETSQEPNKFGLFLKFLTGENNSNLWEINSNMYF